MNNMQLTITSSTTSIDLNDHQNGIYLLPELEGFTGLPEIRTASGVNAGYDGGWTSAQNYDARLIAIRGAIANSDIPTVESLRRNLAAICGQGKTESLKLTLTTEAGNTYTVFVRTISCTMSLPRVLTQQEFLIQFRADDPLIYDEGASGGAVAILQVQQALGGFEIKFELPLEIGGGPSFTPVTNTGSEYVYPVITLNGPLHSPTVVNRTTNEQMQVLVDLAGGDKVIIDSQARTITFNGLDIYDKKSSASSFINIAPGTNQMVLMSSQSSDTGNAEVKFKQGYISI